MAFHRLILIRLNPFHCRRVVTAPRCIAVSIVFWLIFLAVYISFFKEHNIFYLVQPILIFVTNGICGVCYIIVYVTLNKSARDVSLSSAAYQLRVKQNKRVLCTFALVVCSNMACWSIMCAFILFLYFAPQLAYVYDSTTDDNAVRPWVSMWGSTGYWFLNFNAVINPIIYWTRLSDFHRVLLSFCGCRDSPRTSMTAVCHVEGEINKKRNLQLGELPGADEAQNTA